MRYLPLCAIAGLAAAWASSAFADKKPLQDIPLVYKPTESKNSGVVNLTGVLETRVQVRTLLDNRADRKTFGVNVEDSVPRPVTTSSDVAAFCTQRLSDDLRSFGFTVVADSPDVVISGEVLEFMVNEGSRYNGDVRLKIRVVKAGAPVWTGVASGTSRRFGRSYKAENYYETISDSLLHAIQNLAKDPGFLDALRK